MTEKKCTDQQQTKSNSKSDTKRSERPLIPVSQYVENDYKPVNDQVLRSVIKRRAR